jgi:hypothetical protein
MDRGVLVLLREHLDLWQVKMEKSNSTTGFFQLAGSEKESRKQTNGLAMQQKN